MSNHKSHRFFQDEVERRKWQKPEDILDGIGLRPGCTFMDIGCGEGFFAIPAARVVGPQGKVYGVDIDGEAIANLKEKASKEGLANLILSVGEAEETIFCRACANIVFFGIDLHDFRDAGKVLKNASVMLKPDGRLVDLDWKKKLMPFGPPLWKRFSEEKATGLIEAAGFRIETTRDVSPYHYVIVAAPGTKV